VKKMFIFVLLTLLIFSTFTPPTKKAYAANLADNSVIILSGEMNGQNKVLIQANLTVNTGISAMNLELSYSKTAMLLENVVFGSALASLNPITTNTETDAGFSITPFKFNYEGQENDFSTGLLFTLTFNLFANVQDGNYIVALKYAKNKDVNYYDDNYDVKTKNLYIDNAEIQFKNNSVAQIISVPESEQNSIILIVALSISVPIVAICVVLVALRLSKKQKQKDWRKI